MYFIIRKCSTAKCRRTSKRATQVYLLYWYYHNVIVFGRPEPVSSATFSLSIVTLWRSERVDIVFSKREHKNRTGTHTLIRAWILCVFTDGIVSHAKNESRSAAKLVGPIGNTSNRSNAVDRIHGNASTDTPFPMTFRLRAMRLLFFNHKKALWVGSADGISGKRVKHFLRVSRSVFVTSEIRIRRSVLKRISMTWFDWFFDACVNELVSSQVRLKWIVVTWFIYKSTSLRTPPTHRPCAVW